MANDVINTEALLNEAANAAPEQALAESPDRALASSAPAPAPQAVPAQVNVVNPEGKLVSIPSHQLQAALDQGYQQATPEHVRDYVLEQKYGSVGQQTLAGIEGAAKAATFGLSSGVERALGVNPEDIEGRAEVNPGTHVAGEAAGLLASSLIPGYGAANLLEQAGAKVVEKVGLAGVESAAAKIGSAAIKGAVENAIYQAGDEVSKLALGNPNSVQTAAADIGLSGLLGAGLMGSFAGVGQGAKALWNSTAGKQTQGVLKAITDKLGGIEGQLPDALEDAIKVSGIELEPSVRGALMQDPYIRRASQILNDAATNPGLKHQQALLAAKKDLADSILSSLGHTPESVSKLEDLSENQLGNRVKETLINKLESTYKPIEQSYGKISERFKNTIIPEGIRRDLADQLGKVLDNGVSAESAEAKLLKRVIEETSNPKFATLEQLRNYTSGLRRETSGIAKQELWNISSSIRKVLNDAEDKVLTEVVGREAPELISEHAATKSAYKDLRNLIGDLNDRLNVGAHAGPKTFISELKNMDGEAILRRLNPTGKADIIAEISKNFPEVAPQLRQFYLDKIVKEISANPPQGQIISTSKLINKVDKLSPEMREFLIPKDAMAKIKATDQILGALPEKIGKSGTPQGLDGLMSHLPAAGMGLLALLTGHGAGAIALAAILTKALGRDVPDAVRLGLLKFLGSNKEISAPGFKAMVDMIHATQRGESMLAKGTKALFKTGDALSKIIPESLVPGAKDREKLDKQLKMIKEHPEAAMNSLNPDIGHYMPDHATALGATASNAIQYLESVRPKQDKLSLLDPELPVNSVAQAQYNRALDLAQRPLIVLKDIKQGTVTMQDAEAIASIYPDLYSRMSQKLMDGIVDKVHSGESIPYQTRLGLSIFLNQPLDSTMRPESIIASQPSLEQRAQRAAQDIAKPTQGALKSLDKLAPSYATQNQARAAKKISE